MGIDDSSLTPDGALDPFWSGQRGDAVYLGDRMLGSDHPNWDDSFLQPVHGVIIITGDTEETIKEKKDEVDRIFDSSSNGIRDIISIYGNRREGNLSNEQSVFICRFRCKIIKLNIDSVLVS
jgi:hypothetical protein